MQPAALGSPESLARIRTPGGHKGPINGDTPCHKGPMSGLVDADAVDGEGFPDGLEVRRAAEGAVAVAAGGQAERPGAVEQRAAGVAALGADVGLDQAVDRTLGVVHRGVQTRDRAAVHAGGATAARSGSTSATVPA